VRRLVVADTLANPGIDTVLAMGAVPRAVASVGSNLPTTLDSADLGSYGALLALRQDLETDDEHAARYLESR
jgi:hypothetical protein